MLCSLVLGTALRTLTLGGIAYTVRLEPRAAHPLQVWTGGRKVAERLERRYHAWALEVADVDGSGVDSIVVGLTKPTKYLPFPHRTIFVMKFDGHKISRKWAGSSMGRPLLEFCFGPKSLGKPQTLFTLERRLDGKAALCGNRWTGFGFAKVGEEKAWNSASDLRCEGARLILVANGRWIALPWKSLLASEFSAPGSRF